MKFDHLERKSLHRSFLEQALAQAAKATDPEVRQAWTTVAESWKQLAQISSERCFCGRDAVGSHHNGQGARTAFCYEHLREALGLSGPAPIGPSRPSPTQSSVSPPRPEALVPAGTTIERPGLIKSGYAVVTYHHADICLLMPGDMVHPFFQAAPLSVRALNEMALTPVSAEETEASRQSAVTALARHGARCVTMHAPQRAMDLLLEIAEKQAPGQEEEIHFQLPITQEVLARLLGVSAIHMNRIMKQLRETGVLTHGRHHHAILYRSKLARHTDI